MEEGEGVTPRGWQLNNDSRNGERLCLITKNELGTQNWVGRFQRKRNGGLQETRALLIRTGTECKNKQTKNTMALK